MNKRFSGLLDFIVRAFQRGEGAKVTEERDAAYEAFLEEAEGEARSSCEASDKPSLRAAVVVVRRDASRRGAGRRDASRRGASKELLATLESIDAQSYDNYELTENVADTECDLVVRAEEGVVLRSDALMRYAREFASDAKPKLVYSDYDMLTPSGERTRPRFFSEFSETDALSRDIFGGCFAVERKLYLTCAAPSGAEKPVTAKQTKAQTAAKTDASIGAGDNGQSSSGGYALALRVLARAGCGKAKHIPSVLYSRMGDAEALAYTEGAEAIEQYAKATGQRLKVGAGLYHGSFRTGARAWPMKTAVILPFLDDVDSLRASLESIEEHTKFFEPVLVIVDAGSTSKRAKDYLDILEKNRAATVVRKQNVGFSALMNAGACAAMTEGLLFFSPYARARSVELIPALAEQAARRKAGAVGCMLTDAAGYIRSLGYVIGLAGPVGSPFAGTDADGATQVSAAQVSSAQADSAQIGAAQAGGDKRGEFDEYARSVRAVSAVSGMCMYVPGEAFFSAGMFDESFDVPESPLFPVGQDVELSLRLMRHGLTNIYTPFARAELVKQPPSIASAPERVRMRAYDVMRAEMASLDRCYSPNLSRETVIPTPSRSHKPPKPF